MAIIAFIANFLIQTGLLHTTPTLLNNINVLTVISSICNYLIPLPFFLYIMKKLEKTELTKHKLTIMQFIICICITIFLMIIGNIIGLAITSGIGGAMQTDVSNPVVELISSSNIWLNLILISIIGPIFEELLFRKVLIDRTIKYGGTISVLLSALLFGLYHGNINQFFYAAFMGGFFAFVYIKTGDIKYSIGLHMIINFMGSVVSTFVMDSLASATEANMGDLTIVFVYMLIMLLLFLVGLIYILCEHKKFKFSEKEEGIKLEKPTKTIILNIGMVCFIAYHIISIILAI